MHSQQIEIYQSPDGHNLVDVRFEDDTIWPSQQMAELFEKDVHSINEHIKNNIYEGELSDDEATIRKFRTVR